MLPFLSKPWCQMRSHTVSQSPRGRNTRKMLTSVMKKNWMTDPWYSDRHIRQLAHFIVDSLTYGLSFKPAFVLLYTLKCYTSTHVLVRPVWDDQAMVPVIVTPASHRGICNRSQKLISFSCVKDDSRRVILKMSKCMCNF